MVVWYLVPWTTNSIWFLSVLNIAPYFLNQSIPSSSISLLASTTLRSIGIFALIILIGGLFTTPITWVLLFRALMLSGWISSHFSPNDLANLLLIIDNAAPESGVATTIWSPIRTLIFVAVVVIGSFHTGGTMSKGFIGGRDSRFASAFIAVMC